MVETPRGESRSAVDHDSAVDPAALDHDNYVGAAATGETVDTPEASLINRDGLMVSAMLVDIAPEGETFPAFNTAPTYVDKTVLSKDCLLYTSSWFALGLAATARWPFTEKNTWRPAVPMGATAAGGAM